MRCVEVQNLLHEGKSYLYFNAPKDDAPSTFNDEVDDHTRECHECGEELIRLLRKQFRRRPGPIHWYLVRKEVQ